MTAVIWVTQRLPAIPKRVQCYCLSCDAFDGESDLHRDPDANLSLPRVDGKDCGKLICLFLVERDLCHTRYGKARRSLKFAEPF